MAFWNSTTTSKPKEAEMATQNSMTKATLEQIIAQVEGDPLAGQGTFTKRDILIDRLLAHWNTCGGGQQKHATAILTETKAA